MGRMKVIRFIDWGKDFAGKLVNRIFYFGITVLVCTGCGDERIEPEKINLQTVPLENGTEHSNVPEKPETQKNGTDAMGTGSSLGGGSVYAENPDPDREARLAAYRSVLERVYSDHIFPDGNDYGYDGVLDMSENRFAIYDIDQDNNEELIISYITTYTAGQTALIYDYDNSSGTVRTELSEYPLLTCYDNGVIEAQLSHNQGLAADGDFWPYTLYQYDKETDTYTIAGMADAWSKAQAEKDYEGNPFPDEKDADGDGFLYYIMRDGEHNLDTLVDSEEYMQWRDSYVGGAEEIEIPFKKLTEENIQKVAGPLADDFAGSVYGKAET